MIEGFPGHFWRQCIKCIKHTTGDTCRFLGLRELLMKDNRVRGDRLLSHQEPVDLEFPTKWNVSEPNIDQVSRIKVRRILSTSVSKILMCAFQATVATALLPAIQDELEHISQTDILFRKQDMGYRAICGMQQL